MKTNASRPVHRWPVRLTHWVNLVAMIGMFMSGWEIYNASPLFDFRFPPSLTLGGWLGGAIGWHLAVMWLLVVNAVCYLLWSLFSGHLRRDLLPLRLAALRQDIWLTLTLRLNHRLGHYNAIQKLMSPGWLSGNRYSSTGWWRCLAVFLSRAMSTSAPWRASDCSSLSMC